MNTKRKPSLTNCYVSQECIEGVLCTNDGDSTQEALILAEGYWRVSTTSTDVRLCPLPDACAGGSGGASSSSRRQLLSAFSDGYCNSGYTGSLCAVCDDKAGYYHQPDTLSCIECPKVALDRIQKSFTVVLLLAIAVACMAIAVFVCFSKVKVAEALD